MDMRLFQKNRQQFPSDELAKYAGQFVAWSPDGTHILACSDDELRLAEAVRAAGRDSGEVMIAFVPDGDEILLGGGMEVTE